MFTFIKESTDRRDVLVLTIVSSFSQIELILRHRGPQSYSGPWTIYDYSHTTYSEYVRGYPLTYTLGPRRRGPISINPVSEVKKHEVEVVSGSCTEDLKKHYDFTTQSLPSRSFPTFVQLQVLSQRVLFVFDSLLKVQRSTVNPIFLFFTVQR